MSLTWCYFVLVWYKTVYPEVRAVGLLLLCFAQFWPTINCFWLLDSQIRKILFLVFIRKTMGLSYLSVMTAFRFWHEFRHNTLGLLRLLQNQCFEISVKYFLSKFAYKQAELRWVRLKKTSGDKRRKGKGEESKELRKTDNRCFLDRQLWAEEGCELGEYTGARWLRSDYSVLHYLSSLVNRNPPWSSMYYHGGPW